MSQSQETFYKTREDAVNSKQRNEMVINVNLANKDHTFSDQTPTPTRFIRNCEEVGLFQDLQNVNPFDETFKKAVENPDEILLAQTNSDTDTLHTPHILPLYKDTYQLKKLSNGFHETRNSSDKLEVTEDELDGQSDIPIDIGERNNSITNRSSDSVGRKSRNRLAQKRSREKQKLKCDQIKEDLMRISKINTALQKDNDKLTKENQLLKEYILSHHKTCNINDCGSLLKKLESQSECSSKTVKNKNVRAVKAFRKIVPVPTKSTITLNILDKSSVLFPGRGGSNLRIDIQQM